MRRREKEIQECGEIEAVIKQAKVCRVAFTDGKVPYIVPLNFGYKDQCFYFHCAKEGKKLDMLKVNNQVCFELDIALEIIKKDKACDWGQQYASVIGFGKAVLLETLEEKKQGLDVLMFQYAGRTGFEYSEAEINRIEVIKLEVEAMTGKRSG